MSELYKPNVNETLEDRLIRNEIKLGCINPYAYIEVSCTDTDDNKNENLKCVFQGFAKDFEDYGDMLIKLDYELTEIKIAYDCDMEEHLQLIYTIFNA